MSTRRVRLHRWDEIALEKVTEMLSRKIVTGEREMLAQIYLKRGCSCRMHSHESEQMTYVLQGALKFLVGGEEITVREGEVLHIPSRRRAPGRSARGHVRARRVQPDPPGLAGSHRRLLSPLEARHHAARHSCCSRSSSSLVVWAIASYNRLVGLRNQVLNGWRQIDVQLKRRHDLIPNLVNTVRGAMEFERDTLTAVMEARAKALTATGPADAARRKGSCRRRSAGCSPSRRTTRRSSRTRT